MNIVLNYRRTGGAIAVDVPALTPVVATALEIAQSAYSFTRQPPPGRCGNDAARLIADAYYQDQRAGAHPLLPLAVGDRVHAAGAVLELAAELPGGEPVFRAVERCAAHAVAVSGQLPPPVQIAYAEDSRDRLWTGKGAGIWTCLTDTARRTAPVSWWKLWEDHGPMVPLVPAVTAAEMADAHHGCSACATYITAV